MTARVFAAVLLVGALVRVATLPLPGTRDTIPFRVWTYAAAEEGVSRLYGVGGTPLEHRVLTYAGAEATLNMPPLLVHELGLAGRVYRLAMHGRFPNTTPLMIAIKMPALLADVGFALLLYGVARRWAGQQAARWGTTVYWLNPGVILAGTMLGYQDALYVLPIAGCLVAAAAAWPVAAGILGALALLTRPQAAVLGPVVALAIWNGAPAGKGLRSLAAATAAAVVVCALFVAPIVRAGGGPNFVQAMGRLGEHDMLSGNACNLWWIVGYVVRALYSVDDYGRWGAFLHQTQILTISRFVQVGYPNPRPIGAVLVLATTAWALWTCRRTRDLWLVAALGAFVVHAYAVLGAQVHENHLYGAVPLLALAATGRRRLAPVFFAVTAIFTLNLNIFYGISEDLGWGVPRGVTGVDLSVVLAVVNCAALAWHAAALRRETSDVTGAGSTAAACRPAPVPA